VFYGWIVASKSVPKQSEVRNLQPVQMRKSEPNYYLINWRLFVAGLFVLSSRDQYFSWGGFQVLPIYGSDKASAIG
jgi:hypothetical protein